MRILHVLNDVSSLGNGIINLAVDLACAQAESGHTVAIASAGGGYVSLLESCGIQHFPLNQAFKRGPLRRALLSNVRTLTRTVTSFRQIVGSFAPNIVHCHMITGTIIGRLGRLNHRYRLLSHVHNVHERSSRWMRFADKSIAVSDGVAKEMIRWGFPAKKVAVIRNGILGTKRLSVEYRDIELKQPAILTVAGLWQRKNIDGLIAAFDSIAADFPQAHLYVVGEGQRAKYEAIAQQSSAADRIHFEGFKEDPRPYMRAAKIFVLASHRESFALVLQEARDAGAAIIGTNVDGTPEALDYGRAGLLVAPGNTPELAAAIRLLLSDENVCRDWQRAAKRDLQRYTVWHMNAEVEALYRSLLPAEQMMMPAELQCKQAKSDS